MNPRQQIRVFIIDNFLFGDPEPLRTDDVSLLDSGIIDSVGVLELVTFLEEDFGLTIDDSELVPENFDSVDGLYAFTEYKISAMGLK